MYHFIETLSLNILYKVIFNLTTFHSLGLFFITLIFNYYYYIQLLLDYYIQLLLIPLIIYHLPSSDPSPLSKM